LLLRHQFEEASKWEEREGRDQQSEKLGPSRNNTQSLLSRAWDLMETDEKDKLEETYTVAEQLMAFLSSIASSKLVVCL